LVRVAGVAASPPLPAANDAELAEAEAFKNSLINALMTGMSSLPAAAPMMLPTPPPGAMIPTPSNGPGAPPLIMIPTPTGPLGAPPAAPSSARGERPSLKQQNSLVRGGAALRCCTTQLLRTSLLSGNRGVTRPCAYLCCVLRQGGPGGDDEVRGKVREQLAGALQRAVDELKVRPALLTSQPHADWRETVSLRGRGQGVPRRGGGAHARACLRWHQCSHHEHAQQRPLPRCALP
jgi:hypothetical protein